MMTHPPSDAMFASFASGTATPGIELLMRTHLAMAPASRARLGLMEDVGGALLAEADAAPLSQGALDRALGALGTPEPQPARTARAQGDLPESNLPEPLARALGAPLDALRWQFRLPGLHEYVLDGYSEGEEVSLLRARPGAGMLQHTHHGEEATLILAGEMTDGNTVLRPGDVAEADGDHDHRPRITGDRTCYCLIVMSGRMRFTGPLSRALNLFT